MYMAQGFISHGRGLVFISLAAIFCCSGVVKSEGNNQLTQISGCVCPGLDVIFTCSIVGGGNTIWNGSAFDCPSASDSSDNKIVLRHSGFGMQGNSIGMCNEGAIIGRGISVENTCYISQLSVRVNSDIVGKEVSCFYDNLTSETLIGNTTIVLTSGDELPPPSNISLAGAIPSELIFEWSSVTHDCSALHYNIMTSAGCGNCPSVANSTNATCSIQQLQPDEVRLCNFSVQAVLCDSIFGQSGEANFRLKVPGAPTISVIPIYSQQNDSLLKITISFPEMPRTLLSSEISSSPVFYNVTYRNTSNYICNSEAIMPTSFCRDGVCSHESDVTSISCYPFSQITITVFAGNVLGNGSLSNSITLGSTNSFVKIIYDEDTASIFCTFLSQQDTTDISCNIKYVQCQQKSISVPKQLSATNTDVPNTLQIMLKFNDSDQVKYCYEVRASNSSYTVRVDGTLNLGISSSIADINIGAAIGGSIVGILLIIVVAIIVVALIIVRKDVIPKRKLKDHVNAINLMTTEDLDAADPKEQKLSTELYEGLDCVDPKRFRPYLVNEKCELGDFMAKCDVPYRIGSVYYEFFRDEEDIKEDKNIILMNDKTKEMFTGKGMRKIIGAPARGPAIALKKPNIPGHTVFVQSKGIGCRPLSQGTSILYEIRPSTADTDLGKNDKLICVPKNRFEIFEVKQPCNLYDFIEETCERRFQPGCSFFEFSNSTENISENKEVILMKRTTGKLFTGHRALYMIGAPGAGIPKPEKLLREWRVFIQSRHHGARHLDPNTLVLYEEPKSGEENWTPVDEGRLMKLEVEQKCSLESFVKDCSLDFKTKRFFFEFTHPKIPESINENQEVVIMNKTSSKLFTGPEVLKKVGAPGPKVYNPELEDYRVFIENVGGGTRSLGGGTYLLYDQKYNAGIANV